MSRLHWSTMLAAELLSSKWMPITHDGKGQITGNTQCKIVLRPRCYEFGKLEHQVKIFNFCFNKVGLDWLRKNENRLFHWSIKIYNKELKQKSNPLWMIQSLIMPFEASSKRGKLRLGLRKAENLQLACQKGKLRYQSSKQHRMIFIDWKSYKKLSHFDQMLLMLLCQLSQTPSVFHVGKRRDIRMMWGFLKFASRDNCVERSGNNIVGRFCSSS